MTDPFGTADLRRTVLAAWAASPARFREDANTEEDHARGYYRDRVIVELTQNAADAAVAAGVAGHLSLTLESDDDGPVLYARNTGAPLTAAGVQALATMRASAKTSSQTAVPQTAAPQSASPSAQPAPDAALVGRFGVGFAAVRAVSDNITITSRPSADARHADLAAEFNADLDVGVQFDLGRTRQELDATAGAELAREVADRGADLPILRLPVPATARRTTPEFTTTVVLRLRDDAAVAAVRAQLAAVDELLLLALPGLQRVSVTIAADTSTPGPPHTRVVELTEGEWRTVHRSGHLPDSVLKDRPVEERHRSAWSVTWALRRDHASGTDSSQRSNAGGVIHAPTATDEGCGLPATLIATFPLDPSRRHVAPGPVTEEILAHAAAAYLELVQQVAQGGGAALELVPTGLAAGALDASLQEQIRAELPNIPLLPSPLVDNQPQLMRPRDAFTLQGPAANEPKLIAALAEHLPELIWVPANQHTAARALGVQTRALADVVEELPDTTEQLRDVFMAHIDAPGLVDALADLPVRLLDGRGVRGVRGVVIPGDADDSDDSDNSDDGGSLAAFERWGLRVADPQQAHALWSRLGAGSAAPIALLDSAPVQQAITHLSDVVDSTAFREDLDPDDDAALTAVLTLVRRAIDDEGTLPTQLSAGLAGLPLESADGELEAARDLTMPDSLADELFDGLLPVAEDEVEQWGTQTLAALGVRTTITVHTRHDVVADAGLDDDDDVADHSLPDRWPDYVEFLAGHLGEGAYIGEVQVITDLDAVGSDQWGRFLTLVADDAQARAALLTAVRGQTSYAAWWLRAEFNAPFARAGTGGAYLPPVPPEFADVNPRDDDLWTALGAVGDLSQLTPAEWDLIFDQIPDVGADQSLRTALEFWAALATVAGQRSEQLPDTPDRIVARVGVRAVVCAADDVVVSAQPMWTQLPDLPDGAVGIVPAPDQETAQLVADFLEVPVLTGDDAVPASDHDVVRVVDGGKQQQVDPAVHEFLTRAGDVRSETGAAGADGEAASSVTTTWQQHPGPFRVDTGQGRHSEVSWWVDPDGTSHATGPDGLACALAQVHNQWRNRHLIAALLRNPGDVDVLTADSAWD